MDNTFGHSEDMNKENMQNNSANEKRSQDGSFEFGNSQEQIPVNPSTNIRTDNSGPEPKISNNYQRGTDSKIYSSNGMSNEQAYKNGECELGVDYLFAAPDEAYRKARGDYDTRRDFSQRMNSQNANSYQGYTGHNDTSCTSPRKENVSSGGMHAGRYISKRSFIVTIIIAMLLTSILTTTCTLLVGNSLVPKENKAVNYTLKQSNDTFDISSVVKKSGDAIVSITTEGVSTDMWAQNYVTKGAGSGVIVQSDGYIVTCYHVIDGANKISVTTSDSKVHEAKLVGIDSNNDIAVIRIDANNLHAVDYADSSKIEVGDKIVAIGNPLGELSNTVTTGIVSSLNRNLSIEGKQLNLLQTDASINPGNSGGALLDSSGNLIGIVESKSSGSDVEGLGFAVPVNRVADSVKKIIKAENSKEVIKDIAEKENMKKPVIGVMITELSDQEGMLYGYAKGGVVVTSITSDKAKQAGLKEGDMILSMEGDEIKTAEDLKSQLSQHKAGDKVKVQVLRDNKTVDLTIPLVKAGDMNKA